MLIVVIDEKFIRLPPRCIMGEFMDHSVAEVLNHIQHTRIKAKLRYLLNKGQINLDEIQTKCKELTAQPLMPHTISEDDTRDDPIFIEALIMARELIIRQMAIDNIPPPKDIDTHARALIDAMPQIQEKARRRLEMRHHIAQITLKEIAQHANAT